ncbi:MAG: hypothetical protein HQL30_11880 [Candidatus Omnitrophica bacterium]|nr:hypothetical protein [Candidatus Omnitrophota bacterium]
MDFMRKQMASLMVKAAREAIDQLDKATPEARDLMKLDVEAVLEHDITKICEVITFSEITKGMALAMKFRSGGAGEEFERSKKTLQEMGKALLERAERQKGPFMAPVSCRELLFRI